MKYALKSLIAVAVLVIAMASYVHGQVTLFQLSYSIDTKSTLLVHKSEDFRRLKYEVDQLKAPQLLEQKLGDLNLDLSLPREIRIIHMPQVMLTRDIAAKTVTQPLMADKFMNLLGRWVKVAQAKTNR